MVVQRFPTYLKNCSFSLELQLSCCNNFRISHRISSGKHHVTGCGVQFLAFGQAQWPLLVPSTCNFYSNCSGGRNSKD